MTYLFLHFIMHYYAFVIIHDCFSYINSLAIQTLETLDFAIRIGRTPTFLYFDLYLYTAYAAHYVYFTFGI